MTSNDFGSVWNVNIGRDTLQYNTKNGNAHSVYQLSESEARAVTPAHGILRIPWTVVQLLVANGKSEVKKLKGCSKIKCFKLRVK